MMHVSARGRTVGLVGLAAIGLLSLASIVSHYRTGYQQDLVRDQPAQVNRPRRTLNVADIALYSAQDYIARDQGYFKDNGLDVTILKATTGAEPMAELLDGTADVAVEGDFRTVVTAARHPELRIVASLSSTNESYSLFVKKGGDVRTPADLKGKRIALFRKSPSEYILGNYLAAHGLAPSDVTLVDMPYDKYLSAFTAGDIDATVSFQPYVYALRAQGQGALESWPVMGDTRVYSVVLTTAETLDRRRDDIVAYLRALTQAERFMRAKPKETRDIAIANSYFGAEFTDEFWPQMQFDINLGSGLFATLGEMTGYAQREGLIAPAEAPDLRSLIWTDGLLELKPESVEIPRS